MRKKMLIIGIISSALVLTIAVIILALPAIVILGEAWFIQFDIRNPHVGKGFRHWNQVQVEDCKPFSIPEGWTIEEEAGLYMILDESGEVWAYGAILGLDGPHFQNEKKLLETIYNTPIVDTEFLSLEQTLVMKGSYVYMTQVNGEESDYTTSCIRLDENSRKRLVWIVTPDLSVDEAQFDIAEAIVYSFEFG